MQVLSGMNGMLGCLVRVTLLGLMLTSQMGRHPNLLPPLPAQGLPGAQVEKVQVHCASPCSPWALSGARKAGPGGCCALGSQAGSHRLDPRSLAPAGLGAAFSAPLPPGPSGASVAAAVELRRGDRLPLWAVPGSRERRALCAGSEVPFERHYRS